MKDALERLIMLQRKDARILEKRRFIDRVPLRISEVDGPLRKAGEELDLIRQSHESLAKKRREREMALDEANEKIRKMKTRMSEIKTNKEYQAYQKEIDAFEHEVRGIEDQILDLMEKVDAVAKELEEKERTVGEETKGLEAFKGQLDAEVRDQEKDLSLLKEERRGIVDSLDPEIYRTYLSLLEDGDGLAVTSARGEICLGCDMNIPPQLFVEIRKNDKIIQCPQCRRILYFEEDAPQEVS